MPNLFKYVSSTGVIVDLSARPYLLQIGNLLNYTWDYTATPKSLGYGAIISRLTKREQSIEFPIIVLSADGLPVSPMVSVLSAIFEADVLAQQPGRLYINNQYTTGFVVGSGKERYSTPLYVRMILSFVTGSPFWITEDLHSFPAFTAGALTGFILPTALPLNVGAVLGTSRLINDHYAASSAIITIYGPTTDPSFSIGDHIYTVSGELGVGERYDLDQTNKIVVKITSSGERINAFNQRGKIYSVFEPIPSGESMLFYDGSFAIDILLLTERSEPLWN